jgi:hypothetical protein
MAHSASSGRPAIARTRASVARASSRARCVPCRRIPICAQAVQSRAATAMRPRAWGWRGRCCGALTGEAGVATPIRAGGGASEGVKGQRPFAGNTMLLAPRRDHRKTVLTAALSHGEAIGGQRARAALAPARTRQAIPFDAGRTRRVRRAGLAEVRQRSSHETAQTHSLASVLRLLLTGAAEPAPQTRHECAAGAPSWPSINGWRRQPSLRSHALHPGPSADS